MGTFCSLARFQSTCAAPGVLHQDFPSGVPTSYLLRTERQSGRFGKCAQNRFPWALASCSGLELRRGRDIKSLHGCSGVLGKEGKAGAGGVNPLRRPDQQEGRERGVNFGVFGIGKETSGATTSEVEEQEINDPPLIGTMADILNLEKQFAFYGAYHSNKLNILVHMLFVWPIFFTSGLLLAYTPAIIPVPLPSGTLPLQHYMILNVNFVIAGIYALYYAALDKKAGSLGAAICLGCWIGSQAIAQSWPWSTAWKFVLIAQVTCWSFQFIGHWVFEGRAPALLDNLPQAFLMAPFFVLLEFLQSFFGYEPYPGFRKIVEKKIEENISLWRAGKGTKAA